MVPGGCVVLTILGREENNDDSSGKYSPNIWELLGMMLNGMVLEGLIEEAKRDSFNGPFYGASAKELRNIIQTEGSFRVNRLEPFNIGWDPSIDDRYITRWTSTRKANHVRAIIESILASHFGDEIVDVIFQRLSIKIGDYMKTVNGGAYIYHVVSVAKE